MITEACLSKRIYESKQQAQESANYINYVREQEGLEFVKLKVYKCSACSKFHLAKEK